MSAIFAADFDRVQRADYNRLELYAARRKARLLLCEVRRHGHHSPLYPPPTPAQAAGSHGRKAAAALWLLISFFV
jgi:hypothetical protein